MGVQHCSGMEFSLRFISESKCFSSADDFTVQFVGHSGTAVRLTPTGALVVSGAFGEITQTRIFELAFVAGSIFATVL